MAKTGEPCQPNQCHAKSSHQMQTNAWETKDELMTVTTAAATAAAGTCRTQPKAHQHVPPPPNLQPKEYIPKGKDDYPT